jgi:hypothetical protein
MKWLRLMLLLAVYRKQVEEYKQVSLELQRAYLDLAVAFRISMERPEVDLRDTLDALIRDLRDQLSLYEEHVV